MIDVNFGNKTIIAGLAMALILAYGMVNFNSSTPNTDFAFPKAQAATNDEARLETSPRLDVSALSALQQPSVEMTEDEKDESGLDRRKW